MNKDKAAIKHNNLSEDSVNTRNTCRRKIKKKLENKSTSGPFHLYIYVYILRTLYLKIYQNIASILTHTHTHTYIYTHI